MVGMRLMISKFCVVTMDCCSRVDMRVITSYGRLISGVFSRSCLVLRSVPLFLMT